MADTSLDELRKQIDDADRRIVTLLNERAAIAVRIGEVKSELSKAAYDPAREGKVLQKIDALNAGPLSKGALEDIYAAIMTACREIQSK